MLEKDTELKPTPRRSVLVTAQARGIGIPDFAKKFLKKFRAGIAHMFIFHFNINDCVEAENKEGEVEYLDLRDYLVRKLFSQRDFVLSFNISSGIEFLKGEEKDFREVTGFKNKPPNPLARATGATGPQGLPREASQMLPLLEKLLQKKKHKDKIVRSAVIIEYPESVVPADVVSSSSLDDRTNAVTLLRWARDPRIAENGNIIILLASNLMGLHEHLRAQDSGIEAICIEKPTSEERLQYIEWLSKDYQEELKGIKKQQLAYITAGLNRKQIEDVFLGAHEAGEKLSFNLIKKRKEEILKQEYGELLEVMDTEHGMEAIGGLEKIKEVLGKTIEALKIGNWRRVPMGALFVGPPGTGKTVFAEAVAKESDFNFAKIGSVRDKYVGESEKRLYKVLLGVKSLMPVVVVVDEFDQAFGRRDETSLDSGVGRRMFGKLLEFISDTTLRGKVFWIGITNRPDLIDAAMKRPGRFDLKIPFPFPTLEEKKDIFAAIMRKYRWQHSIKNFTPFAQSPFYNIEGEQAEINGSDIEEVVVNAYGFASDEGREEISEDDLWKAVGDYIPTYNKKEIDHMTRIAYKECSSRLLLPHDWKEKMRVNEKKKEVSQPTTHQRKIRAS